MGFFPVINGSISSATLGTGAITAASIAADAIGASEIGTNAIDADSLAADAVTEIQAGLATSAALTTVQADTDNIQTRLPAALDTGRMDSAVNAIGADVITAASIAAGAIDAATFAASAIDNTAIAAGAISLAKFSANAIDSTILAANSIGASQIAASAIDDTVFDESAQAQVTLGRRVIKSITFTGGAGLGAVGSNALFTVTGNVLCRVMATCSVNLEEAGATATIVAGTATDTNAFMAQINAVDFDANEKWIAAAAPTASPVLFRSNLDVEAAAASNIAGWVVCSENIILTVGAQAVNGGTAAFIVYWVPLTSGSSIAAA